MTRAKDALGFLRGVNENTAHFCQPLFMKTTNRIGVSPECEMNVNADFISPCHCEITCRQENGLFVALITDKSDNGTYLNGKLIGQGQTVILYPGSIISFVSGHLSVMYIQAHKKDLNYSFEEDFLTPLYPKNKKKSKEISVTTKTIGSGSQAEVVLANVSFDLRHQLACKKYRNKYGISHLNQKALKNTELSILESNKHANVMSMISEFEKDRCTHVFLPLYVGGTLRYRINRSSPILEDDAFFIFHQIASGLQYLHQKGIIHCDLKPDNILLTDLSEKPRVVINDFGLSIYSKPENCWPSNYGTLAYHSPEIVREENFTENVDCWALGVILYEVLSKQHPFADRRDTQREIKHNILNEEPNLELLRGASSQAKELIAKLLEKDPKERLSTKNCFSNAHSSWMYKNCDQAFYTAYLKSQKHFKKERAFWFDGEEDVLEEPVPEIIHPDDDKAVTENLKRKRGSSILVNNKRKSDYIHRHEDDFLCLQEELFPTRTLQKKTLLECLSTTKNESGHSSGSSKSASLQLTVSKTEYKVHTSSS